MEKSVAPYKSSVNYRWRACEGRFDGDLNQARSTKRLLHRTYLADLEIRIRDLTYTGYRCAELADHLDKKADLRLGERKSRDYIGRNNTGTALPGQDGMAKYKVFDTD